MAGRRGYGEGSFFHDVKRNNWQYKLTLGYDCNGFPVRKTFYAKTRNEAHKKGQACLNRFKAEKVSMTPDMKLGSWAEKWLLDYKAGTMKQTSFHQLEILVDKIPSELMKKKISDITPSDLQGFLNRFSVNSSKSYIKKMQGMLKSIFVEAQDNGLCEKNPARRIKSPKGSEKARASCTPDECVIILKYADEYDNNIIATAIVTMLYTGLRRGEVLGLSWDDIKGDVLTVNRGVYLENNSPTVKEQQAKTAGSLRSISIVPELMNRIIKLPHNGKYIFGVKNGGLMHPRNFSRDYNIFFDKLQKVYPDCRKLSPHCCRHTCATLTLMAGADSRVVQEILGHTDIKTTSRYIHPNQQTIGAAMAGLNALIMQGNQQDNTIKS